MSHWSSCYFVAEDWLQPLHTSCKEPRKRQFGVQRRTGSFCTAHGQTGPTSAEKLAETNSSSQLKSIEVNSIHLVGPRQNTVHLRPLDRPRPTASWQMISEIGRPPRPPWDKVRVDSRATVCNGATCGERWQVWRWAPGSSAVATRYHHTWRESVKLCSAPSRWPEAFWTLEKLWKMMNMWSTVKQSHAKSLFLFGTVGRCPLWPPMFTFRGWILQSQPRYIQIASTPSSCRLRLVLCLSFTALCSLLRRLDWKKGQILEDTTASLKLFSKMLELLSGREAMAHLRHIRCSPAVACVGCRHEWQAHFKGFCLQRTAGSKPTSKLSKPRFQI